MDWTIRLRHMALLVLRGAGVIFALLAFAAAAELMRASVVAVRIEGPGSAWMYLMDIGLDAAVRMVVYGIMAVVLCRWSGPLAMWLVPRPGSACLRCKHPMEASHSGVCPECGTAA